MQSAPALPPVYSTVELIQALRAANPDSAITEYLIRGPIRKGLIPPPPSFSRCYLWRPSDVRALVKVLGLTAPRMEVGRG